MFEYINTVALASGLLFIVAISLVKNGSLDFEKLENVIKPWKDAIDFLSKLPHWIQFYNNLKAKKQKLEIRKNKLNKRLIDVRMEVEDKEFQTGRRRKREVDSWLSSTETKCNEVQTLLQEMERLGTNRFWKFIYLAWLGNIVEKKILEVNELLNSKHSSELLSPVKERWEFVSEPLVGYAAKENVRKILTWLGSGITKIGVHGIKGIGKTELIMHVYNELLKNDDLHVYMISVLENYREYELQREIAILVGIDLQEEDERKRAALLYRALRQRKFVLILDGVKKHFYEDKVGIPLEPTKGKMIVTSRSPDVCRRIGCHRNMVPINTLLDDEALLLFCQKVELVLDFESTKEILAKKIVAECRGVPRKIIDIATELKGTEETSVWEKTLNDILASNAECLEI